MYMFKSMVPQWIQSLRLRVEHNLNKGTRTESGSGSTWWYNGGGENTAVMKTGGRPVESSVTCEQGRGEVLELVMNRVQRFKEFEEKTDWFNAWGIDKAVARAGVAVSASW